MYFILFLNLYLFLHINYAIFLHIYLFILYNVFFITLFFLIPLRAKLSINWLWAVLPARAE